VITLGNGRKKLNRYMIDQKIPRDEREKIIVLRDEQEILWIIGGRISETYKITENTVRALQVVVTGPDEI